MSMNKRKEIAVLAATCALIVGTIIALYAVPVFADTYKATVKCYFVKQDGTIVGVPPEGSKAEYEVTWDSSQGATTTVYLQKFKGYALESETVENVANGDVISIEYKQLDPLEPPGNVKVKVVDIQPGAMKLEGGSVELTGDIATLEITFDKARKSQGVNSYWVAALKKTGPGSNDWNKMGTGTMPFIVTNPKAQFEEGEVGPNGEKVTETEKTITVEKKVCKRNTPTGETLDQLCYKPGDNITIRAIAERGKYETYENSKEVEVNIPFDNSSKGKTFTEKGSQTPTKVTPKVTLPKSNYTYDGKEKKPGVTVRVGKTVLKPDAYKVSYAKGRKNVGKYAVRVDLKGKYVGSNTVYFTITPPPTNITSLKASKKSVTVKWKKQKKQTSGYQIQASLDKDFNKVAVNKRVSGAKKVKATLKRVKSKKKYYVRIRTFKTVKGAKYYSPWRLFPKAA